jgi:hypothetical protein
MLKASVGSSDPARNAASEAVQAIVSLEALGNSSRSASMELRESKVSDRGSLRDSRVLKYEARNRWTFVKQVALR